jgi:uncharacterized RDD family membrane protein YckC
MAKLLVQESSGAREFELVDLEVNIGRELDNTLRLADPSISRHHAVLRRGPSGYEIQDLQSSNGVLLNGNRVESAPLHDGDRITLGQMQMTFIDPQPPAAGESSPLGTVRMGTEAMARLRASTSPELPPEPAAPAPAPAPAFAVPMPPPQPAPPAAVPAGPPVLGFLQPWLPSVPDDAIPVRMPDGSIERGDFVTRALANLIDYVPALALGLLGILAGPALAFGCILGLVQLALAVAYLIILPLCWMHYGASPGKKIMKLRVVPEANPAGRIDLPSAVLRLLGYLVCAIISGILMAPISLALLAMFGRGMGLGMGLGVGPHLAGLLVLRIISLAVAAVPYLIILGAQRKGLEDLFSKSIVIKVDR